MIVVRKPLTTFSTDVRDTRMSAVSLGDGQPVVLVHGFGVSGAYMLPLAEELAESYSVLIPDLPGQGDSESLDGRITIPRLASALADWVEANELGRPAFVANSMGCQVVTELAVQRPELVGPIVLIGPTIDPAGRAAPRQLLGILRESRNEPLSLIAQAARDDTRAGIRILYSVGRAMLDDRIEDRLPSIEQPTIVIQGADDGFCSRDWAAEVAELLPEGRLVIVPGEPHAVHYTRPELVAGIVRDLLVEEAEDRPGELAGRL